MNSLKSIVVSGLAKPDDEIRPTGIPTDILLTQEVRRIPSRIDEILQDRSIAASQVTPQLMESMFAAQWSQYRTLYERGILDSGSTNSQSAQLAELRTWGGSIQILPEDYLIPKVTARIIWGNWWIGDSTAKIPPLSKVRNMHLPSAQKKRFSDLKFLMNSIIKALEQAGRFIPEPSVIEVGAMFDHANNLLGLEPRTPTGRVRRTGQLAWSTVVKQLRKKQSSTNSGEEAEEADAAGEAAPEEQEDLVEE